MPNSPTADAIAVQVLWRIYGQPSEWKVSHDEIAAIIDRGFNEERRQHRELVQIYQEAIQAVDLLSEPLRPEGSQREQLRSMLSDRLEAIHRLLRQVTAITEGSQRHPH
jgi:HD superfamily phosphodiesterase